MRLGAIVVLSLTAGVASAQNVTFSFASDVASNEPTFEGQADTGVISVVRIPTGLEVDDANGPLPTLSYDTRFYCDFQLTYSGSFNLPGGQVLHTYGVDGTFRFQSSTVMQVTIEDGVLTALGDANGWGSTATIQASSLAGSNVNYEWQAASQAAYNLFTGASTSDMTDAAFTLTDIFSFPAGAAGVPGVTINPQTGLPNVAWESEGSYSGSAFFVPAPGTAMIAGLGLTALGRRRRNS